MYLGNILSNYFIIQLHTRQFYFSLTKTMKKLPTKDINEVKFKT